MSVLDTKLDIYRDVINLINKQESKGKGLNSIRKKLNKKIEQIEYLKSYN
jgi:hypothetical protein|tara:strand:+ start:234 stop:383 length:150 start_codon:yes stop_codon:yes gene_type:complete